MGLAKEPFLMNISLLRPAHPKKDYSPSPGPALQRIQPCPRRTSSLEGVRIAPRTPSSSRAGSALPQGQLRGTRVARKPNTPLCSARPGPAPPSGRDPKENLRSPWRVSPQPSWLRPPLPGRKLAVSQTTRQTEMVGRA